MKAEGKGRTGVAGRTGPSPGAARNGGAPISGFLLWFYLVAKYSASGVASFSFLSPLFAVLMGWGILGERIGVGTWGALILVSIGLILINRKRA